MLGLNVGQGESYFLLMAHALSDLALSSNKFNVLGKVMDAFFS
jgi:hypothetical protein